MLITDIFPLPPVFYTSRATLPYRQNKMSSVRTSAIYYHKKIKKANKLLPLLEISQFTAVMDWI